MTRYRPGLGILLAVAMGLAGCAPVLIGAGAVGGYAASKDSVIDHFDQSPARVFAQALRVAHEMGAVTLQDEEHGRIEADLNGIKVTISVTPITDKTVQLKIKARNKFFLPKVSVAQDVYAAITEDL